MKEKRYSLAARRSPAARRDKSCLKNEDASEQWKQMKGGNYWDNATSVVNANSKIA